MTTSLVLVFVCWMMILPFQHVVVVVNGSCFIANTNRAFHNKHHRGREQQPPSPLSSLQETTTRSRLVGLWSSSSSSTLDSSSSSNEQTNEKASSSSISTTTTTRTNKSNNHHHSKSIEDLIQNGILIPETFRERYGSDNNHSRSNNTPILPNWLLDKCSECGWEHPTRIQQLALDAVLVDQKSDVVIQAETGSGKTLAYLIPCLAAIDPSRSAVQALIVVPTRELGLQVARVAKRLAAAASSSSGMKSATTTTNDDKEYTNNNVEDDYDFDEDDEDDDADFMNTASTTNIRNNNNSNNNNKIMVMNVLQGSQNRRQRAWAWAEPPHVIIGTPQELCNMVRHGGIKRYNSVKCVVVDEVDACLLNNAGSFTTASNEYYSGTSMATPLHELLSKHLSPTYDDGSSILEQEAPLSASASSTTTEQQRRRNSHRPLSNQRQTIFCSATIPQIRHFLKQCVQNQWMLQDPELLTLRDGSGGRLGEQLTPKQLQHAYVVCASTDKKFAALRRIIKKILLQQQQNNNDDSTDNNPKETKILVFTESHRPMEEMAQALAADVRSITGNDENGGVFWKEHLPPSTELGATAIISVLRFEDSLSQRAAATQAFRGEIGYNNNNNNSRRSSSTTENNSTNSSVKLRVMFSTDLAARGLDIVDISHVIHFDLPPDADTYVHRAGRTGRCGRDGQVLSIVTADQEFVLTRLANKLSLDVPCIARQQQQSKKRKE